MNGYVSWLIIVAHVVCANDNKFVKLFDLERLKKASNYLKPSAIISLKNTHVPLYIYKHQLFPLSKNINNAKVLSRSNRIKHKVGDIRRHDKVDLKALSPKQQHEYKVKRVIKFIQHHHLSANYFYEEMKRIERQHVVKDDLRKMVTVLEHIPEMKKEMLKTFRSFLHRLEKVPDLWLHKTNQLIADLMQP